MLGARAPVASVERARPRAVDGGVARPLLGPRVLRTYNMRTTCIKVTLMGGLKDDDMHDEPDGEPDEYSEYEEGFDDDSDDMDFDDWAT